jgi:hypothetical protein
MLALVRVKNAIGEGRLIRPYRFPLANQAKKKIAPVY